jgi:hypothetical protein
MIEQKTREEEEEEHIQQWKGKNYVDKESWKRYRKIDEKVMWIQKR